MPRAEKPSPQVIEQFAAELAAISLGEPVTWGPAAFVPLIWTTDRELDVALLEEEPGVDVEELGAGQASVPEIKVRNRSQKLVLITDGTLVEGAYQNRVINVTFLVAPKSEKIVPVSCVEAGRWGGRKLWFKARRKAPLLLRARARREIQESQHLRGRIGRANQGRVWADVNYYLRAFCLASPTENLMEAVDYVEKELTEKEGLDGLATELTQRGDGRTAGVATVWRDRVAAVDLFAVPRLFEKVAKQILTSYLFDLQLAPRRKRKHSGNGELVRQFLTQLPALAKLRKPPLGVGIELEIDGPECTGNAVLYDGKLCHMSVFGVA